MRKLFSNLKNSLHGLTVILGEHSFGLEIIYACLTLGIGLFAGISPSGLALLIMLNLILLAAELFNSAIERLCDRITTGRENMIRDIKDIASAAVFLILIANFIGTILVFIYFD